MWGRKVKVDANLAAGAAKVAKDFKESIEGVLNGSTGAMSGAINIAQASIEATKLLDELIHKHILSDDLPEETQAGELKVEVDAG